ncbi:MAG: methyltransferase domain-containing protein [Clostridiales bacterium]|nr:methyltransferase domain-containing protein [Clostridiales bacterium]
MDYILRSARFIAADVFNQAIRPGDTVVDATMGNGHDTLTLCRLVGPEGRVYAFDVQPAAVENTRMRLEEAGVLDRATLFCLGHEHILEKVPGPIALAAFNLGWLPGGDKSITTHWETTRQAVEGALSLLKPMGVCVICAYPGHQEGDRERGQLIDLLAQLPPQQYNVLWNKFLNAGPGAPECFVIQRQ